MEEDLYVSHYAELIRRNWLVVLVTTLLGAVVGVALVLFFLPRQYRAATSVLLEANNNSALSLPASIPGLTTIAQKLGLGESTSGAATLALAFGDSQTVRLAVVDRLDLVRAFGAPGKYDAEHRLENMTAIQPTNKGTLAIMVTISGTPRGLLPRSEDDLGVRTLARDIANEYVTIIHEKLNSLVLTRSQRKANFLRDRVDEAREELDRARQALAQVQGAVEYVAPIPSTPPELATLATYEKEAAMAAAEESAAAQELAQLKAELDDEELMVLTNVVSQRSSIADRLRESMAQAQADLAALYDKGYSDEHPDCRELQSRIKDLERSYTQEVDAGLKAQSETRSTNPVRSSLLTSIAQLEGDRASAAARRGAMEGALAQLRARVAALPGAMERVAGLQQELEVKATVYEVVTQAYEMARVEAEENSPQFTVLDEAIIPPRKVAPSGTKTCLAATVAGFMLGVIAAPSWGRRRRRREATGEPDRGS